ncbi:PASTA domain-containing protein [Plantactinospora endophytica]|uniref:PASTA domain-containing protein n=1 Tax=Plantactinospora endophytica TaxID=673535 RepID=A0ABQ4E0I7_9ACTN|nr:PASTA domain-containing protein [Plantactinospora endophytica]GIG88237.1 hypothetical protein Pen02_31730 [Plantactinospora endophytica]
MSAAPTRSGWPFLVGRGRDAGYRMLLTPRPVADADDSAALLAVVTGEVPEDAPPVVTVLDPRPGGELCVVYRTLRPSAADAGTTGAGRPVPLLDRAGRPLVLAYGFVCRGGRVTRVDEDDLRYARQMALDAFRRFHADEAAYRPGVSEPYPLRSEIVGRPAGPAGHGQVRAALPGQPRATPPGQPVVPPGQVPAWRADALPSPGRYRNDRWRPPALLLGLCALLLGLAGTGLWLTTRPTEVRVPQLVELPEGDAVRELHDAGLHAEPRPERWTADCRPGRVVAQTPVAGTRIHQGATVEYVVCLARRPPVPPAPSRSTPAPESPPSTSPGRAGAGRQVDGTEAGRRVNGAWAGRRVGGIEAGRRYRSSA